MDSFSIVLCTCDGARFLEAQLRTLAEQPGVDDIVILDDASTDDTMPLLQEFAARDPRVRLRRNPSRVGVVRNFERGLRLARNTWVALADQDDIWLPGKLAALRAAWDGQAVLLHHATRKFRGQPPGVLPARAAQRRKFEGCDLRRLLYRNSVVGHTMLLRRDVACALMPFPADVPHDWWLAAGAAVHGPVQYLDQYLVHYRIHDHNTYHRAGSRLRRMRAEHELRLRLLDRLDALPTLADPARKFLRRYRELLIAAGEGGTTAPLFGFYWRHADLLFGNGSTPVSWWTRARKSLAALCGALAQRPAVLPAPGPLLPGRTGPADGATELAEQPAS